MRALLGIAVVCAWCPPGALAVMMHALHCVSAMLHGVCVSTCGCVWVCVCACVQVCMCACVHVCMCAAS